MKKATMIILSILVLSATSASAQPSGSRPCELMRLISAALADVFSCGSGGNDDVPVPLRVALGPGGFNSPPDHGDSGGDAALTRDRWRSPLDQRGARHDSGGAVSGGKDWTSPPDQGGGDSANSAGGPEAGSRLSDSRFRSPPSGQG